MDISQDATLDDLKKIINDKRNIPQDNLYNLFHFCSDDIIDDEDGNWLSTFQIISIMVGGGGEGKISKLARVVLGNRSGA